VSVLNSTHPRYTDKESNIGGYNLRLYRGKLAFFRNKNGVSVHLPIDGDHDSLFRSMGHSIVCRLPCVWVHLGHEQLRTDFSGAKTTDVGSDAGAVGGQMNHSSGGRVDLRHLLAVLREQRELAMSDVEHEKVRIKSLQVDGGLDDVDAAHLRQKQ
jgi:hypothetical protein